MIRLRPTRRLCRSQRTFGDDAVYLLRPGNRVGVYLGNK